MTNRNQFPDIGKEVEKENRKNACKIKVINVNDNIPKTANYLGTLGKALDIMDVFSEYNQLSLSQISKKKGYGTTVAYRILYTLSANGFLHYDPATKMYSLGQKMLLLGRKAMENLDIRIIARPFMEQLMRNTNKDVLLCLPLESCSFCIDKLEPGPYLQNAMRKGGTYPLHKGASNRVMLAFLPAEQVKTYINKLEEPEDEKEKLKRELLKIRNQGYDFSIGLLSPGIFAAAFPIFNFSGKIAASISIGDPYRKPADDELANLFGFTREAAERISRALGYAPSCSRDEAIGTGV
jgi:DNA-binding IclR family transcriptional regulator